MHKIPFIALVVAGPFLGSLGANAQTSTTTTCTSYRPNSVDCQSRSTPDMSSQIQAQNEATARGWNQFFAALQARRDRNAAIAQHQQLIDALAAERQATLAVEAQRDARAASRESARDEEARSARAAEDERNQARLDLFTQRAELIRKETLNKNPLIGKALSNYIAESGAVLGKLFIANPLATNAEIKEALGPVDANFAGQSTRFTADFRAAVTSTAAQYKIPRRDFGRFRSDAWEAVMKMDKFDIQTNPLLMREFIDRTAQEFVPSAIPAAKAR